MLIKATRLHPGPVQSVIVETVVVESVVDIVFTEIVVDDGMTVVEAGGVVVVRNMSAIADAAIWWISFLALSSFFTEGHPPSPPPSSTVICT